MKKIITIVIITLATAGLTFGQAVSDPGAAGQPAPQTAKQMRYPQIGKTSVTGNLAFIKGKIAVQSDNGTYYAGGINRLIGFVDGLKEGANVTLEGYTFEHPQKVQTSDAEKLLRVTKLTFNGKTYELDTNGEKHFAQMPPPPPWTRYYEGEGQRQKFSRQPRHNKRHKDRY
jgi:hypothetical protein